MSVPRAFRDLDTAFGSALSSMQGFGAAMADVNVGLRQALSALKGRGRGLPDPYCKIRHIVDATGNAYDQHNHFLLTLDPEGVEALLQQATTYIELRKGVPHGEVLRCSGGAP